MIDTASKPRLRRVWIDIDNPPQVQYLAPFAEAFAGLGVKVLITARDHGIARELLRERGLEFQSVGEHPGASKLAKTAAVLRRTAALTRRLRPWRPDAALFATRSAALASPLVGVPGFALVDYEFVDLRAFRIARSYIVHPSVVGAALREQGLDPQRLIAYDGIKEDITFAAVDLDSVEPHRFADLDSSHKTRLLVRPPDDRSHYHRQASSELTLRALEHLAGRDDVVVILSPRYPEQAKLLDGLDWRSPPLVLDEAVPFERLLLAVDAVLTGGGTMAREAAYLGVPSFSVYSGRLGAVDRYLEESGRLVVLRDAALLDELHLERRPRTRPLASNPKAVEQIVDAVSLIARERS
jgi:hypothetical protein